MLHQPHQAVYAAGFDCPPHPAVGSQGHEQLLTCPQPFAQSLAVTEGYSVGAHGISEWMETLVDVREDRWRGR